MAGGIDKILDILRKAVTIDDSVGDKGAGDDLHTKLLKTGGFGGDVVSKRITFDGGTLDGIGDIDGTSNPATIFSVTGSVIVRIFAICDTGLIDTMARPNRPYRMVYWI